jgi:phosphinothricin acetyltransferase
VIALRPAVPADGEAMAALYAPYVTGTAITFEYEAPDGDEFRRRMAAVQQTLPWLVAEEDGTFVGYAYASPFHPRAAYAWSAELSIYLAMDARGRGLGTQLYGALLALLKAQGYARIFALITHPNEASEAFHRRLGFREAGHLHEAGSKLGRWWDVAYWELSLASLPPDAPQPVPFSALPDPAVQTVLQGENPGIWGI